MEFKSLEMSGFKSFVDHTRITFSGGVAVVFGRKVAVKATLLTGDMFYEGLIRAQANHVHRLF
jgi:hypothetical protein